MSFRACEIKKKSFISACYAGEGIKIFINKVFFCVLAEQEIYFGHWVSISFHLRTFSFPRFGLLHIRNLLRVRAHSLYPMFVHSNSELHALLKNIAFAV